MSRIYVEALVTTWWLASVMGCPFIRTCSVIPTLASETKRECDVYMQPGAMGCVARYFPKINTHATIYRIVVWLVELGRGPFLASEA
eukprot:COSAG01_NODE_2507_length_7552_cov_56.408560_2_plen_87_part_00